MIKLLVINEFKKLANRNASRSKRKKKVGGAASYLILMGVLGLLFAPLVFGMFSLVAKELAQIDAVWLGYTYSGIAAIAFSVMGSVFMAQSQLYRAKDNEFLLSLPIKPWQILFSRMLLLYVQNFYCCLIILLPAYIACGIYGGVTVLSVIFFIIGLLVIPLFCLTLSCILGFLVALIASRLKHANIVSVILSLIFLGAYFYVYFQFSAIAEQLLMHSANIGAGIKAYAYPLYALGTMMCGNFVGFIITFAICTVPFALTYLILSKTYIGIITRPDRQAKSVYKEKKLKRISVWSALIGKEAKTFFRSTAYLLNCGLGVVLLLFFSIAGGIYLSKLAQTIPGYVPMISVLICTMICMISTMDAITAPSISLEGKNLYILQTLPIPSWKPLYAKVFFHVIFNAPMAVIASVVCAIVLKPSALIIVAMILTPIVANFLFAGLGLLFNLKKPMLDWQNETVVVKQSVSVLFTILCVFAIFGAHAGLYFLAVKVMSAGVYLIIALAILSAGAVGVMVWLKKRGAKILEDL